MEGRSKALGRHLGIFVGFLRFRQAGSIALKTFEGLAIVAEERARGAGKSQEEGRRVTLKGY